MKKLMKGFTLIELLIVIAILGILAVALLLTINPGEAQKKARDVKRQTDLKTLVTLMDQYLNDGNTATAALQSTTSNGGAGGVYSTGAPVNAQTAGASSWLTIDTSKYGNTVPTDPVNQQGTETRTLASSTGTITGAAVYRAIVSGSDYEINVRQESTANSTKIGNDGGDSANWFEAGTKLNLFSTSVGN